MKIIYYSLTFSVKNRNRFSEESSFVLHSANPLSIGLDRIQLNSQIHFCIQNCCSFIEIDEENLASHLCSYKRKE